MNDAAIGATGPTGATGATDATGATGAEGETASQSTPLGASSGGWDYPAPHCLSVQPLPEHIDGLAHTNNAVYVQWCERVAWSHSHALGLTLEDYRRLDRAMAIRHGHYDYLLPSFEGEPLILGTWLTAGDGKLSMERRFQLRRQSDGETVMRGRWSLVCIDISAGRPRRMPPEFIAAYQAAVVPTPA